MFNMSHNIYENAQKIDENSPLFSLMQAFTNQKTTPFGEISHIANNFAHKNYIFSQQMFNMSHNIDEKAQKIDKKSPLFSRMQAFTNQNTASFDKNSQIANNLARVNYIYSQQMFNCRTILMGMRKRLMKIRHFYLVCKLLQIKILHRSAKIRALQIIWRT